MFNSTLNYKKYNTLELEPLIKQAMLAHGWPRDVIPRSIEFGISDIHRCGKGKEYGYTAGDGAVLLYDYRSRGTEPIKIKYSDFDASSTDMTPEERNEADRKDQLAKQEHLEARQKATAQADTSFNSLSSCAVATEYTNRKQIKLLKGVRNNGSDLIIPLKDANGQLRSLQTITENGDKLFAKGCEVDGHFHIIDDQAIQDSVIICEGYATAVSIQMATGMVTVAAFSASNIASVIQAIKSKYPDIQVLIAGDDDWLNKDGSLRTGQGNSGQKYALGAAKLWDCRVVFPDVRDKFMDEAKTKPMTDFNDVHVRFGIDEVKKQIKEKSNLKTKNCKRSLKSLDINEFLAKQFPLRKMLISPIIPEKGLVMLYAPRGIGKTFMALSIACIAASGSSMLDDKWRAEKPSSVLYVDGEMPMAVLQERLAEIILANSSTPDSDKLRILAADFQEHGIPDLSTKEGQNLIEEHLNGVDLLILDNLSALCRSGRENESESWAPMQEWLLELKRRNISVIIIHHANKNGSQRGNSKKEDLLDTVIVLRKSKNYDPQDGACFELHYEKARGFFGKEAKPFMVKLTNKDGKIYWQVDEIEEIESQQILKLHQEGVAQRQIAEELGLSQATVSRRLKILLKNGGTNA